MSWNKTLELECFSNHSKWLHASKTLSSKQTQNPETSDFSEDSPLPRISLSHFLMHSSKRGMCLQSLQFPNHSSLFLYPTNCQHLYLGNGNKVPAQKVPWGSCPEKVWSANESYSPDQAMAPNPCLPVTTWVLLPSPPSPACPPLHICSTETPPAPIQPHQGMKITKDPAEMVCKYQILLKH